MDRGVLLETMKERGIREKLRTRITEVLRETRSRVRVGEEIGEGFWTARRVRQGCPLSPFLFNMLMVNLEEAMGKGKIKEIKGTYAGVRERSGTAGGKEGRRCVA